MMLSSALEGPRQDTGLLDGNAKVNVLDTLVIVFPGRV